MGRSRITWLAAAILATTGLLCQTASFAEQKKAPTQTGKSQAECHKEAIAGNLYPKTQAHRDYMARCRAAKK
jgi:hypothetical protein